MVKRMDEKSPSKPLLSKASTVLKDPRATPAEKSLAGRVLGEGVPHKKGKK
jgi:hypothetical protein